ncbi:hypothetical protein [Cellulomonas xylanilytica]|uniref:Uncharacterized protein n=1 Tax=Cellulomonas xylanilytica TaxID=233583 RepID=A0A510VAA2_9CELL|nr:hypothetical protein [Cellulomonas xylanilytica]GEK22911.1 hypothetical protein CXY01_34310 [Cellulomonas xylanilytica]
MTEEAAPIPNPYLAAIRQHRGQAVPVAADLRDDLDAVVRAMDAGAWLSPVADAFYVDLTGHKQALTTAADGAIATYDSAVRGQPEQVEPGAWQTRWRNLR